MPSETIVAVFDTAANADAAVRDLENAGIPSNSIKRYDKSFAPSGGTGTASYSSGQTGGFWAWLLGEEGTSSSTYDRSLYERTVESGGTVVTVIVDENEADRVISVLDAHSPADLEQRASDHGLAGNSTTGTGTAVASGQTAATALGTASTGTGTGPGLTGGTTGMAPAPNRLFRLRRRRSISASGRCSVGLPASDAMSSSAPWRSRLDCATRPSRSSVGQ